MAEITYEEQRGYTLFLCRPKWRRVVEVFDSNDAADAAFLACAMSPWVRSVHVEYDHEQEGAAR